jgi:HlyD family secretion protein
MTSRISPPPDTRASAARAHSQLSLSPSHAAIRRLTRAGMIVVLLLVGIVGGWAGTAEISGAVIASGIMVVDSNVRKVQHQAGGIVGEIRARDGDKVKAGDILVRLDETATRANLAIVTKNLDELLARKARLIADLEGEAIIHFPKELTQKAVQDAEVAHMLKSERKVLELRINARFGQKAQLTERNIQLREEIAGSEAQERSKSQEIAFIQRELEGARALWNKNLIPISKLTILERDAARLEGERAKIIAAVAAGKGKISEIILQILQVDRDASSEISRELREVESKIGELVERKVAAEDQMRRIDIRAPHDGTVHQSIVHTVGGVVTPTDVLMLIVPFSDTLVAEVKVQPQDIDQLWQGQTALLRFPAFSQRTTPEISGSVSRISPDITLDQRSGGSYYTVRIALSADEVGKLGDVKLVPGMPVEALIKTGDRRVISYLVKPLQDQINRAFRER